MVTVGEILLYFFVIVAVTVLLLWIGSKVELHVRFRRRFYGNSKINEKFRRKFYGESGYRGSSITIEEMAEGKKIHDYVTKQQYKYTVGRYPLNLKTGRGLSFVIPYEVPGIHEVIAEEPYQRRFGQSRRIASSIPASSRVRNKMQRYFEIMNLERNEEKLGELNNNLYSIIENTKPENIEVFEFHPGLVFNYNRKSVYFNIRGAGLNYTKDGNLLFIAYFKNRLSFEMDIREPKDKTKEMLVVDDKYSLYSSIPDAAKTILNDKKVHQIMEKLVGSTIRLYYEDDQLFAILKSDIEFIEILNLTNSIFQASYRLDDYEERVEELKCYNCDDPFDLSEEFCDKCDAPRPTCIVCLLDLNPSEKEQVLKLPCCGIYAHKEHINQWLSKNSKCPNCQENLAKLLKQKL
ncbi:MAG: hypothetical protein GOP50_10800 [Candidatus Heimdallarchaeota archaeon]|nr:hypothetical protein [Candidatus Heimdallarchaeota archaeon]